MLRREAEGGQAGAVKVVVPGDPGDGAAARGEAAEQKRAKAGGGAVLGRPRDLVQAAERQPTPGQRIIDLGNAQRHDAVAIMSRAVAPRIGADQIVAQTRQDLATLGRPDRGREGLEAI